MIDLVAKRYVKAIISTFSAKEIEEIIAIFRTIESAMKAENIAYFFNSPFVDKDKKEEVLLGLFDSVEPKFAHFLKLLVHSDRIQIISELASHLERKLLMDKKQYVAVLKARDVLDSKTLEDITKSLSKKLGANFEIRQEKASVDGIKLSVEDLGIEISFSKDRFLGDLTSHILKAI